MSNIKKAQKDLTSHEIKLILSPFFFLISTFATTYSSTTLPSLFIQSFAQILFKGLQHHLHETF